jgi:hypothetical protein
MSQIRSAFSRICTWVFAGERLNALLTAAQDLSVVERQLAALKGDLLPTETRRQHGLIGENMRPASMRVPPSRAKQLVALRYDSCGGTLCAQLLGCENLLI